MTTPTGFGSVLAVVRRPNAGRGVWVLRAAAVVVLVLGTSGVLTQVVFTQQSLSKWGVTVAGPAVVLGLTLTRRPVTYLAVSAVAVLPFLPISISFKGLTFPLAAPVLVAGVAVAFLVSRGPRDTAPRGRSRVKAAALVALLCLLPSMLRGTTVWLWLLQVATLFAVGYLIARSYDLDPDAGTLLIPALGGTLALQGLLAFQEVRTGRPLNLYGSQASYGPGYFFNYGDVPRPSGSFTDPISLGNCLALGLPLLLVAATQRREPPARRLWYCGCALVAAGALVLTFSRMSWVGAAVGIVLVLALSPVEDRLGQVAVVVVGAIAVSLTAVVTAGPVLAERFSSIFHPTATGVRTAQGDEARQQLWAAAARVISEHPVMGVGRGNLNPYLVRQAGGSVDTHAHSTYLQVLAETGVVGAIGLLVLLVAAVVEATRRLRATRGSDAMARCCLAMIAVILVVLSTDYTIRFTGVLGMLALPFVLLSATRPRPDGPRGPGSSLGTGGPSTDRPGRARREPSGHPPHGSTDQRSVPVPPVLLLTSAGVPGGVWRHVAELATGLRQRGVVVRVEVGDGLRERADALGLLGAPAPGEIVHVHLGNTYDVAMTRRILGARLRGQPVVVTEHLPHLDASDPSIATRPPRPGARLAKTALKRLQYAAASQVVVLSSSCDRFVRSRYGVKPELVSIVPNGVEPEPMNIVLNGPVVSDVVGRSVSESWPSLVAVGSVIAQKGFDVLLDAAEVARGPWTVDVWGTGTHLEELKARADGIRLQDGTQRVRFRGWSDEVPTHLGRADALVVPSRWEAMPYSALEAMAAGKPVIATAVDGLVDVVDDGRTGFLVHPDGVSLASGLDAFCELSPAQAQTLGEAGRRRVGERFTLDRMVDGTVEVYRRVAGSR